MKARTAAAKLDMSHVREDGLHRWYVVRTNIRCEARAVKSLRAAKYRVYLPQMKMDVFNRRKKVMTTRKFVLFNRYLFVRLPVKKPDWYSLRACDGVECVLGINGAPMAVQRRDIALFMLSQRYGLFDELLPSSKKAAAKERFKVGSWLHVRPDVKHPFGGFYGQVKKIKGRGVVQAMVAIFGQMTPVDLSFEDIEPALDYIPSAA